MAKDTLKSLRAELETAKQEIEQMSNMEVALKDDNERLRAEMTSLRDQMEKWRKYGLTKDEELLKKEASEDQLRGERQVWQLAALGGWVATGALVLTWLFG